jgi:hypothetical protein
MLGFILFLAAFVLLGIGLAEGLQIIHENDDVPKNTVIIMNANNMQFPYNIDYSY